MSLRLVCASRSCQRPCAIINITRWPHDPPRWRRGPITACRNAVRVCIHVCLCYCSRVLALPPQRNSSAGVQISVPYVHCADPDRRVRSEERARIVSGTATGREGFGRLK